MKSNRTHSTPPIIEDLGDNSSYYNFNIEESEREENEEIIKNYDYDQVTIKNPVTKTKIKDRIILENYDLESLEEDIDNLDIKD